MLELNTRHCFLSACIHGNSRLASVEPLVQITFLNQQDAEVDLVRLVPPPVTTGMSWRQPQSFRAASGSFMGMEAEPLSPGRHTHAVLGVTGGVTPADTHTLSCFLLELRLPVLGLQRPPQPHWLCHFFTSSKMFSDLIVCI